MKILFVTYLLITLCINQDISQPVPQQPEPELKKKQEIISEMNKQQSNIRKVEDIVTNDKQIKQIIPFQQISKISKKQFINIQLNDEASRNNHGIVDQNLYNSNSNVSNVNTDQKQNYSQESANPTSNYTNSTQASLPSNTSIAENTAIGNQTSLPSNTSTIDNTAISNQTSLPSNTSIADNTAISNQTSLPSNTSIADNTVINKRMNRQKVRVNKKNQKQELFYCGRKLGYRQRKNVRVQGREKLVSTAYGFEIYVDSKDYTVSQAIASMGTWQPGYINLIGHIVKPGYNVLNLGSQSGLEALIMGKIVGPTGKLFIFQPYSVSNQLVTKSIALNNLSQRTTIYKKGASDTKQTQIIQISYANTGGSEIVPTEYAAKLTRNGRRIIPGINEQQQVEVDRVDQILPKDVILDFALLDVEKMQVKALKGMKGVIERSPNLIIMTEWQYLRNGRRNQQEARELLTYMIERGYKIYSYSGGNYVNCTVGNFHEFRRIEDLLKIDFMDIFFIPKDMPLPA